MKYKEIFTELRKTDRYKIELIKHHLGKNAPDWILNNCLKLLNDFEENIEVKQQL